MRDKKVNTENELVKIPFELTDEQKHIRKAVTEWAQGKFEGKWNSDKIREHEGFPFELHKEAVDLGYVGSWIPENYGGGGLGTLDRCVISEALCSVDPFFGAVNAALLGSESIYLFGTKKQKEKYLPKIFENYAIFSVAYTEASGGTDVASATTKAEKKDKKWLINGEKQFITNAGYCDHSVVLCRTTPKTKVDKRYQGLTQILIENPNEQQGWSADKIDKMGGHWLPTYTVGIMDVTTPTENIVGKINQGFKQSMKFFDFTRPWVAAQIVGTAQCCLDLAIEYSKERDIFERKLSNFQSHKFRLAEMAKLVESARYLVYKAAWLQDKGQPDPLLTSCAKWQANDVIKKISDEALLIHGGYGYSKDYRIERIVRDSKLFEITEGTSEAEKMAVSRELLRK